MKEAILEFLRGPTASRGLRALDIDPKRYWLLMDLFGRLSDRRELFGQLGRNGVTLQMISGMYFLMTGFMTFAVVMSKPQVWTYFATFQGLAGFLMFSVLLSEAGNSLVNPVESLVLAHQPVNGPTYTAAKLSHLLRILLYLVPALSGAPALGGLLVKDAPWVYPVLHIAAALAVGFIIALLCCAAFGWLIRLVPAARLKAAGQMAEMMPWLAIMTIQFSRLQLRDFYRLAWVRSLPLTPTLLVIAAAASAAVLFGLRSLSVDYLVRVSSIVHGASSRKNRVRRSRLAAIAARWFGGPGARAGFEYTGRMMLRDYQFRRQMVPTIAALALPFALVAKGWRLSPFSGQFTFLHILPHALGIVLFLICAVLVYGEDYKGSWLFLLAPAGVLGPFAHGVYACLWFKLVIIPHIVLLAVLTWTWGILDAAVFIAYSLAMVSAYLALELRSIDGLPFGKPPEIRSPFFVGIMFIGGIVIAAIVGVQYFLLFRSRAIVLATAVALGIAAYFGTRSSLRTFEVAIRFHLGHLSTESKGIYQEVDA